MNSLLTLGAILAFCWIYYAQPVLYVYLIAEDWWGEYGTAVCYLIAFVLMLFVIKKDRRFHEFGYMAFAAFLFLIGMEEMSWGQRLLNLKLPNAVSSINYQAELSLHNSFNLPFQLTYIGLFAYCSLIWLFVFPLLADRFENFRKWSAQLGIPRVLIYQMPLFLGALFFCLIHPSVSKEIGELFFGFAFLNLALDYFLNTYKKNPVFVKVVTVVIVVSLASIFALAGSRTRGLHWRMHRQAALDYPKFNLNKQAEVLFQHMLSDENIRNQENFFLEYSIFLWRNHDERADAILGKALEEQQLNIQEKPEQPGPSRLAGMILKMMNQEQSAQTEFQNALAKDNVRLQKASQGWERSYVLFSMAKTYFEMGDYTAALENAQQAKKLASTEKDKLDIHEWIRINKINQKLANR